MSASLTIIQELDKRCCKHPDRIFARFLHTGEVDQARTIWSWAELQQATMMTAAHITEVADPGDRALLVCNEGLEFIAGFLGCLRAGVIAVPVAPPIPTWRERNLAIVQAIAADAVPRVVLSTQNLASAFESVHADIPQLSTLPWLAIDDLEDRSFNFQPDINPDDIAFLQYTSGSTGTPKGVIVRHRNIMANMKVIQSGFKIPPDRSSGVCWLPMFHDMGLIGNVLIPIYSGMEAITYMTPTHFLRKPIRWLQAISEGRAGISGGPDFAYEMCCDRILDQDMEGLDLSCWRVAYSGSMPVRKRTLDRFAKRFASVGFNREAFLPAYGLAEATLMVSGRRCSKTPAIRYLSGTGNCLVSQLGKDDEHASPRVSCGLPAEDHEVVIVDPNSQSPLNQGTVGEIWLRGPSISSGYWGKSPFDNQLNTGEGPYFRTGDLGTFVEDGTLIIVGRTKDLIVYRGRSIHPEDLEATIAALHDEIRSGGVAVWSVDRNEHEEVIVAVEVPGNNGLSIIRASIEKCLVSHHGITPDQIVFLKRGSLLKTSSGKIRRADSRQAWLSGQVTTYQDTPQSNQLWKDERGNLLEFLMNWMHTQGELKQPEVNIPFADQGLDSLKLAELASVLESHLSIEVPVERFYSITPQALADSLEGDRILLPELVRPDFTQDLQVDEQIRPIEKVPSDWPVLLITGVSGFLGAFLLFELLEQTSDDLLCLVRAVDPESGLERIRRNLLKYDLWQDNYAQRIRVQVGDLAEPRLGLNEKRWRRIANQITGIYHCGAHVHWGLPYDRLRASNVIGTLEISRLACDAGGVPLHFVSSLGVFPVGISPRDWFEEEDDLLDGDTLDLGYFQSKWVSERQLQILRARGLPVTVYRPGFIGPHAKTGRGPSDQHQLFIAFLAGCLQMGAAPEVEKVIDIMPVDDVARSIVALSIHGESHAYNLLQEQPMQQRDLYTHLRQRGYALRTVAYARWRDHLLEHDRQSTNPLVRFRGYYRTLTPARMRRMQVLLRTQVPISQHNTRSVLEKLGICTTPLNNSLIDIYLNALINNGSAPALNELGMPIDEPLSIEMVDYDIKNQSVHQLYSIATTRQWSSQNRIDWTVDTDPKNPLSLPDNSLPIYGSEIFEKMDSKERDQLRLHVQSWQLSQFLHGEQGALLCASKIVQHAPSLEARMFAGTQVMDEARHVDIFNRLLSERYRHLYPISSSLKTLLDDVFTDTRWDVTYLGMQVLIEGLAIAAFSQIRDQSSNPLAKAINTYVMEDEARHVMFGRLVLTDYYPKLTQKERDEREELVVEGTYLLRDRFEPTPVFEALGLPVNTCINYMRESGLMFSYRKRLFSRIVPTVRAIGLWGPKVQTAYEKMGLLEFGNVDLDALRADDERVAEEVRNHE